MRCDDKRLSLILLAAMLGGYVPGFGQAPAQPKPKAAPAAANAAQEPEPEYTEEEYDAYEKADKEPDLDKKAQLLTAFMEKYPKSKLMSYIDRSYQTLMYDYNKNQNWAKLQPLAETWLKSHPDDLQAVDYIAASAYNLGQWDKFVTYGLKVYAAKPNKEYAYFLAQSYKKLGNEPKYLEWTEKSFPYFPDNFAIRMEFVDKYVKEKNFAKAAEYAQMALKSLELAKKPDATADAEWQKYVRETKRSAHYIMGINAYEKDRYPHAISELELALQSDKRFGPAYYYIALSQWKLNKVEEAIESFCKASLLKGETQSQAKEHLEKLYKGLHNNTTIGIEKVYRRNEAELGIERTAEK
jgi:tetratricopeptide (TPR) repeat protein